MNKYAVPVAIALVASGLTVLIAEEEKNPFSDTTVKIQAATDSAASTPWTVPRRTAGRWSRDGWQDVWASQNEICRPKGLQSPPPGIRRLLALRRLW